MSAFTEMIAKQGSNSFLKYSYAYKRRNYDKNIIKKNNAL